MAWLSRFTTRHRFPDGGEIVLLHRYALRYIANDGREFSIGFEQALEPGVDRLIHPASIEAVGPAHSVQISEQERTELLARVLDYCSAKRFTYRVVDAPADK